MNMLMFNDVYNITNKDIYLNKNLKKKNLNNLM